MYYVVRQMRWPDFKPNHLHEQLFARLDRFPYSRQRRAEEPSKTFLTD